MAGWKACRTRGNLLFCFGTRVSRNIRETSEGASGAAMKAAELLATGEVEIEPIIAVVEEDLCSGCRICESVCPYQAIEMKAETVDGEEKNVAQVLEAVCQGCGACAVACPTRAIDMQHYKRELILAQVAAAAQGGKTK